MGRKPLPDFKINQIILMSAQGEKPKSIQEATGVSIPTITAYQKKYEQAIAGKREELDLPAEPTTKKDGFIPVDTDKDSGNKEPKKEKTDPIIPETTKKFITKGSEYLSKELEKQIKESMEGAKILLDAKLKYQKSLDEMGVPWDKFIDYSFKIGYDSIQEAYLKEIELQASERALKIQTLSKLHDEEVRDLAEDEEETPINMVRG